MTVKDLEATIKLLVANGKSLREAGYKRVAIGDLEAELASHEPPPAEVEDDDEDVADPLGDGITFGSDEVPRRRGFPPVPKQPKLPMDDAP